MSSHVMRRLILPGLTLFWASVVLLVIELMALALHEWRRCRGSDYFEHPPTTALCEPRGH
jgi:hypothetical protein